MILANQAITLVSSWIDHRFVPLLVDSALKSFVLLALAYAATRLMRNRSAALRHLIWCAGDVAILIIPLLALALPSWRALPASMNPNVRFAALPMPAAHVPAISASMDAMSQQAPSPRALPGFAMLVFIGWLIGAALCLLPALVAQIRLWRFLRRCRDAGETELTNQIACISRELCLRRSVRLLISDESFMPMTCGMVRAKLVLPRDSQNWPSIRNRAVLLHELAHVKRLDCLTHLIAQIVRAIYWFNPLSWVAVRQMQAERERACDDLVTGAGIRRADYAHQILEICAACRRKTPTSAAMPIAGASPVERRIREILNNTQTRGNLTMRHILMAIVVMALLVIPISMLRGADAPTPNATKPATQPARAIGLLDFKGRDQMTQVAQSMKMILLGCCMYANDHAGVFPADQGELVPLLLGNTHADGRATLFVDPRSPVDLPKEPSADWVNKNSPWIYIGGGMRSNLLEAAGTTIVIHSDLDKPFGDQIIAGFADGHVEYLRLDDAKKAIEQSKQRIADLRASDKGKI